MYLEGNESTSLKPNMQLHVALEGLALGINSGGVPCTQHVTLCACRVLALGLTFENTADCKIIETLQWLLTAFLYQFTAVYYWKTVSTIPNYFAIPST
jgi:hypothetical protein